MLQGRNSNCTCERVLPHWIDQEQGARVLTLRQSAELRGSWCVDDDSSGAFCVFTCLAILLKDVSSVDSDN